MYFIPQAWFTRSGPNDWLGNSGAPIFPLLYLTAHYVSDPQNICTLALNIELALKLHKVSLTYIIYVEIYIHIYNIQNLLLFYFNIQLFRNSKWEARKTSH